MDFLSSLVTSLVLCLSSAGLIVWHIRAWQRLQQAVDKTADEITFQRLIEEDAEKEKMYYI